MLKRVSSVLICTFCIFAFSAAFATAGSSKDVQTKTMEGKIVNVDKSKEKTNLMLKNESGKKVQFTVSEDVEVEEITTGDKVNVKYTTGDRIIKSISELSR